MLDLGAHATKLTTHPVRINDTIFFITDILYFFIRITFDDLAKRMHRHGILIHAESTTWPITHLFI